MPLDVTTASEVVVGQPGATYARYGKRALDLTLGILLIPLVLPAVAVLALIVLMTDGHRPFFVQARIGRGGRVFPCFKLRTMIVDSESALARHLAENADAAAEWARDRKLRDDPRITRIGRFLRKTSLDELPQLWNVLRGDMSLVGPRPIVRAELARYGEHSVDYLALRPGITGLWQISGRNDVSYDERVALDVRYRRSMNPVEDLRIMLMTAAELFRRTGH